MKRNKRNQIRLLALSEDGRENVQAASKVQMLDNLEQVWVTKEETEKLKIFNEDVCYIVDPFDDQLVPHIVGLGYPVISPQCALTLAKHNIRLSSQMEYPVANLTMRGLIICFSNIGKTKRVELSRLTRLMGGTVTSELTLATTHLVISEVGSVKYFKASEMGIATMKTDWVEHLWTNGQNKYISAKEAKWDNFVCPILAGCAICITGFQAEQRKKIAQDVEMNGGSYSGAMKLNVVTHLICAKPEGQKYTYAKNCGAKLVDLSWLYESIEKGWCQDSEKYPVKQTSDGSGTSGTVKASSPKAVHMPNVGDIAKQAGNISSINMTHVNETVNITMEAASHTFLQPNPVRVNEIMQRLSSVAGKVGLELFDGVSVFLTGFTSKETDKLTKLLAQNGATTCGNLTSNVSHAIVGDMKLITKEILTTLKTSAENAELSLVNVSWVVKSLEDEHLATESDHWVAEVAECPFERDDHHESTKLEVPEESTTFQLHLEPDHDDLLSQYTNPADETYFASKQLDDKCFKDKRICLVEFTDNLKGYYTKEIKRFGGSVVSDEEDADFIITPLITKRVGTRSNFWLEKCLKDNTLHDDSSHLLFRSFDFINAKSSLRGKDVYVENFDNLEVKFIAQLLNAAGSTFTENKFTASYLIHPVGKLMKGFDGKCLNFNEFVNEIRRGKPATCGDKKLAELRNNMARIKENRKKHKELQAAENKIEMKKIQTPMSVRKQRFRKDMEGLDTPGTIFQPGHKPKFFFDIDAILKHLQTPEHKVQSVKRSMNKKKNLDEFDLEEVFQLLKTPKEEQEKLRSILKEEQEQNDHPAPPEDSEIIKKIDFDEEDFSMINVASRVMEDVVIYISKKLSQDVVQELHTKAKALGATISYQYENTCTHFISEGKSTTRECKQAKSDDKYIVSLYWLRACHERNMKVDERLYPPTFNPDKSIQCETRSQDTSSNDSSQKARDELKKTIEGLSNAVNAPLGAVRRLSSRNSSTPSTSRQQPNPQKVNKVPLTQDVQVGWDDPTSREEMARLQRAENGDLPEEEEEDISHVVKQGDVPKFMFSGVSEGKQKYIDIIKSLGGEVLESNCFDNRCTHLIMQLPDRREKFLSAIAHGTWNLHISYFDACKTAERFVNEEPFEYGDSRMMETLLLQTKLKEHSQQLMEASRRWRIKLHEEKKTNDKFGAFIGWNVLMLLDKTFSQAFARIVRNGGGKVAGMTWPYDGDVAKLTHAIVDANSHAQCADTLVSSGVHVCERQYISDFLIQEHAPSPSKYYKRESDDQMDDKNPPKKIRSK